MRLPNIPLVEGNTKYCRKLYSNQAMAWCYKERRVRNRAHAAHEYYGAERRAPNDVTGNVYRLDGLVPFGRQ